MQIIGFLFCFLVIIAAFPRLYDVFTKHMEQLADEELQKYMQANKARSGWSLLLALRRTLVHPSSYRAWRSLPKRPPASNANR